jgi:anti-sigma factor RsiW
MAKSCEEVSARMMELLYGELPDGERAAIESHLADCERCRAELAGLRSTRAIARQALDEAPPARAHQAILRAAAAAAAVATVSTVADRQRADEKRAQPAGPSFWDRLRARWTLPTLATVGAVAVFLLASKIFLEPEKTYERGRQGLAPAPVEAPAPAPTTAGEPATAPAAEAVRSAPSVAPPKVAAPASDAPAEGETAVRAHAGPGATGGLSALGSGSAQIANKRHAAPERPAAKEKSEVAREAFAEPPAARRADRAFAQPPPPRSAAPALVTAADDGQVQLDHEGSGLSRQREGRGSGGGASDPRLAEKKSSAPAKSAAKGFGGVGNDLAGNAGAPAGQASPGALAKAAPPRERNAGAGRAQSAPAAAPAPPPPASAPMAAKRDRDEAASEGAMADEEAPVARSKKESDKSARKAETPVAHADRLFSEGRWAEAAAAYRDLLRRDPRHADAGRWRQRLAAAEAALASPSVPAPP